METGSQPLVDEPGAGPGLGGRGGGSVLAGRGDFPLGRARVLPSRRVIEGPGGSVTVEPRVMQVLLALADAGGEVVGREELLRLCWPGVTVGEDSLNRAVAEARRVARTVDGGFAIQTIQRVGYCLTIEGASREKGTEPTRRIGSHRLTRRRLVASGAVLTLGGLAGWALLAPRTDPRAADLMQRAEQQLRYALPDSQAQGVSLLREAVAIEPRQARAWGLLALALRQVAENASPDEVAGAVQASENAARRALELDPREGNALTALATLQPSFGDWLSEEKRLLEVLEVAPNNVAAISALVVLLQQVARQRESWSLNERALELDPLSPVHQFRRSLKQWIFGRVHEADITIERALHLWPRHPAVWNARVVIFAFTQRARAGLLALDDPATRPDSITPETDRFWRVSLTALATQSRADIAAARAIILRAAVSSPGFAHNAIMVLSALGDIDAAFAVAEGYFLRRGPTVGSLWTGAGQMPVNDHRWRRNMMLWTPPTARMRADPRFKRLCEGIGLTDYWRRRGIRPEI
jgi:DNA-binding winged helix-turn-helix (wHTH) protein/tetratricopeptide (TPR) repeat protein